METVNGLAAVEYGHADYSVNKCYQSLPSGETKNRAKMPVWILEFHFAGGQNRIPMLFFE